MSTRATYRTLRSLQKAAYEDKGTRSAIRQYVIPNLERLQSELAECRRQCANNSRSKQIWDESGFVTEERYIGLIIKQAKERLSEYD